jgi:hypothetical protein
VVILPREEDEEIEIEIGEIAEVEVLRICRHF